MNLLLRLGSAWIITIGKRWNPIIIEFKLMPYLRQRHVYKSCCELHVCFTTGKQTWYVTNLENRCSRRNGEPRNKVGTKIYQICQLTIDGYTKTKADVACEEESDVDRIDIVDVVAALQRRCHMGIDVKRHCDLSLDSNRDMSTKVDVEQAEVKVFAGSLGRFNPLATCQLWHTCHSPANQLAL